MTSKTERLYGYWRPSINDDLDSLMNILSLYFNKLSFIQISSVCERRTGMLKLYKPFNGTEDMGYS